MGVGGDVREAEPLTRLVQHDVAHLRAQRGQEGGVPRMSEDTQGSEVEDCGEVLDISQLLTLQTVQVLQLKQTVVITVFVMKINLRNVEDKIRRGWRGIPDHILAPYEPPVLQSDVLAILELTQHGPRHHAQLNTLCNVQSAWPGGELADIRLQVRSDLTPLFVFLLT